MDAEGPADSWSNVWNTVDAAMATMFPEGTRGDGDLGRLPLMPADVFALAAYLVERGGVYHRFIPPWVSMGAGTDDGLNVRVRHAEWQRWCDLGRGWRDQARKVEQINQEIDDAPDDAAKQTGEAKQAAASAELLRIHNQIETEFWAALRQRRRDRVVWRPVSPVTPEWWEPALALMVIADEASTGFGYLADKPEDENPFELVYRGLLAAKAVTPPELRAAPGTFVHLEGDDDLAGGTTTLYANPYVVRVLPKCRTPVVGCTMRSLTHNLALVPPAGIVDFSWNREMVARTNRRWNGRDPAANEAFNVLLIPFPYHVTAECFVPANDRLEAKEVVRKGNPVETWPPRPQGRFKLEQRWLHDGGDEPDAEQVEAGAEQVVEFLLSLVKSAGVGVHGVVLPELALDWRSYDRLVRRAATLSHPPDFIVCGLSAVPNEPKGNYVATTMFEFEPARPGARGPRRALFARTRWRQKHHRWLLSGAQIKDYGLAPVLDPNLGWWESIGMPRRKVDLVVYRSGVIFSAMICEDLARNEPCHEPLKAIGPNLVFALLMDGPQLKERWSARYATVLADDPGSSVLTLTSLGLINRQNGTGHYKPSRVIGLWKDDTGHTEQITCPEGAGGVLVTLASEPATERTLDGRTNGDTVALRYHGQQPVRLPRDEADLCRWIADGPSLSGDRSRQKPSQPPQPPPAPRPPRSEERPAKRDLPPGSPGPGAGR